MNTEDSSPLTVSPGLDLDDPAVWRLLRRIYWRRHAPRVERLGLDPDDVYQDVALAVVRKQASPRSRYDPGRAGLSKYLYMVCGSIISHAAEARRCRPDLVLDDGREDEDGDAKQSPMDLAVAPDCVSMLDLQDLQEAGDEATDRLIPLPVLLRVVGGQDARDAAQAEGLDMFASAELAEAWRSYAAGREARVDEEPVGLFALFG